MEEPKRRPAKRRDEPSVPPDYYKGSSDYPKIGEERQAKYRNRPADRAARLGEHQFMSVPKGSTSVEDLIEDTLIERELDPETIIVLKDLVERVQATRGKDVKMIEELEESMHEAGFSELEVNRFIQREVLGKEEFLPEAEEEDDDRISEILEEIYAQEKRKEHVPAGKEVREGPEKGEHRKQKKERSILTRWLGLFSPKKERGKGKGIKVRRRITRSMQGKRTGGRKPRTFRDAA